jgi:hypothetical protein
MKRFLMGALTVGLTLMIVGQQSSADVFQLDFQGNAGFGILPGNENPPVASAAIGSETGGGLVYDDVTNILSLEFTFSGLTGGLFNAGDGGIHLHDAGPTNPFNNNGGIEINLNSGFANVAQGATGGSIDLDVVLTEAQEAELLNGQYYLNIHSASFTGGELRANLVLAIPEPTSSLVVGLGLLGLVVRRKR